MGRGKSWQYLLGECKKSAGGRLWDDSAGFVRENIDARLGELPPEWVERLHVKSRGTIVLWVQGRVEEIGSDDLVPLMVFSDALARWPGSEGIDNSFFLSYFAVFQSLIGRMLNGDEGVARIALFGFDDYEALFRELCGDATI